ncbi:MAG: deoxyribonuclease IV [Culicoidibacterales bacterium]
MIKLGSHVSMNGKKMFIGSVEEALSYNANAMMLYTGAPQNTRRKPMSELNVEAGQALMLANGLSMDDVVVHAPYIINLANTVKPETYELATMFLRQEIERAAILGAKQIVLHPGAHVGAGVDAGIASIIQGLNEVLDPKFDVKIALETMAGKGTECGRNFEELARIFDGVTHNQLLSVCFDTCHTNDAGYNIVEDFDGVLAEFDRVIGKERISVLHINDSKNIRGAQKDRHENIGFGTIGFEALNYIVHHPDLPVQSPRILETPYVQIDPEDKKRTVAPYKLEIAMLRAQKFDANVLEKLKKQV